MARSALFYKNQLGGLSTVEDMSRSTGNRFYVDSGAADNGDTNSYGQTPDAPFATIDFAVSQCTANNGDIIYAMPGHAEVGSAAGALDFDVAGITLLGIGDGAATPTVTLDTAITADVDIDAANVTIENIHFIANFLDITAAIDVNADDFTLRNCRFTDTSATLNAKIWVQDAAATASDRITIEGCHADAVGTANTHFLNLAGTGHGHVIRDNILMGIFQTMCLGGAGVVTKCSIINNYILNTNGVADGCINMAATATGICADNRCCGGHATGGIVNGDLGSLENYYEDFETDLSGSLEPAVA